MELVLTRRWLYPRRTIGELTIDGRFECYTCEDTYRPPPEAKVPKETCIPTGKYDVVINHSKRFGVLMPLLIDVPGFEGIRIHPGNTEKDTEGCILVGTGRLDTGVACSRLAYDVLFTKLWGAFSQGDAVVMSVLLAADRAVC